LDGEVVEYEEQVSRQRAVIVFALNECAGLRPEAVSSCGRQGEFDHAVRHVFDVGPVNDKAGLLLQHNPFSISDCRGNDGQTGGHSFEDDIGEAFVLRTEDQKPGLSQQSWNVVAFTQESDMVWSQTKRIRFLLQGSSGTTVSSRDNTDKRGRFAPRQRQCVQKAIEAFGGLQAAHGYGHYTLWSDAGWRRQFASGIEFLQIKHVWKDFHF